MKWGALVSMMAILGCGGGADRAAGGSSSVSTSSEGGGGNSSGSGSGHQGGASMDGGTKPPLNGTGLYNDYQKTSPHFAHVSPMYTDFYYGWTPDARDWAAAHFDMVMSGTMSEWKSRNPTIKHIPYRLHWSIYQPGQTGNFDYVNMSTWFGDASMNTHHYPLESAFLHYPAGVKFRDYASATPAEITAYKVASDSTKLPLVTATGSGAAAERIQTHIWDSWRYLYNPADKGSSAYLQSQVAAIVSGGHDGVFYDEYGSGGMSAAYASLELGAADTFQAAAVKQLANEKAAFAGSIFMPNTAEYTAQFDLDIMNAAGHVHMEKMNNPLSGNEVDRWNIISSVLASGVIVEFVAAYTWTDVLPASFVGGNYPTPTLRLKMAELASYYLIRPVDAASLLLDENNAWSEAPSSFWLKAEEANVGAPLAARTLLSKTTDGAGQVASIYMRDYERALVLVRPVIGWDPPDYGDDSKVTAPLPAGETWYFLNADGTTSGPVTTVDLRVAEAAIVLKKSRISGL